MVGEDEDGMVVGRIGSPPALPRLVPRSRAAAEHVPAHDGRAGAAEDVLGKRRAGVDLAAFLAVHLSERLERDQPAVELLTADPERMLRRLVGPGDEAVDRHRDVQLQLAHRSSLSRILVGPPSASEVIGEARTLTKPATPCAGDLCRRAALLSSSQSASGSESETSAPCSPFAARALPPCA